MPGAVEFLASYFVGKQLGAQQNVDANTANRLGVTQAVLGLTPVSLILVNEIAKRDAQPDGASDKGANTLTVPLSAFGAKNTKAADTGTTVPSAGSTGTATTTGSSTAGTTKDTSTAPGAQRVSVDREVPIGRLDDLVQAGKEAFGAMKDAYVALREETHEALFRVREAGHTAHEAGRAAEETLRAEETARAEEKARAEEIERAQKHNKRGATAPPGASSMSQSGNRRTPTGD